MMINRSKTLLILFLFALVFIFYQCELYQYLNLQYIQSQRQVLVDYSRENFFLACGVFFALYIVVTGLSLPGAVVMTLVAGAIFGFWWALILVSFASTLGATLAFIISRWLLKNWVQEKFNVYLQVINEGIAADGRWYLFTLRLVPLFPFFVINLLMGLTPIKTWHFYWVSQLGMLGGTVVFVNAGLQLGELNTVGDIFNWRIILSFSLLGVFPLLAKQTVTRIKNPNHENA